MSEEIDYAIDAWITNPETFDPKAFKIVSLLRGKGAKAAHARFIKVFFTNGLLELQELASGNADEQLKEAYKFASRKNVKKLIDFYESIAQACDQIAAEAKVLKKPRATKVKPAEELVKKIKYKLTDDKLGVTSVPAAGFIAKTSAGLSVKGTSIVDFTEKSVQKTLRKPVEQLKDLKLQNTQRRVETWIGAIKATDTVLNGRMNADIMILKVFK
jgi:DNA-directed RNA polymerase beta' subunit